MQKRQQRFLVSLLQLEKTLGDLRGLSCMPVNRVLQLDRVAVMHKSRPQAKSPERSGSDLVSGAKRVAQQFGVLFTFSHRFLVAFTAFFFEISHRFVGLC